MLSEQYLTRFLVDFAQYDPTDRCDAIAFDFFFHCLRCQRQRYWNCWRHDVVTEILPQIGRKFFINWRYEDGESSWRRWESKYLSGAQAHDGQALKRLKVLYENVCWTAPSFQSRKKFIQNILLPIFIANMVLKYISYDSESTQRATTSR